MAKSKCEELIDKLNYNAVSRLQVAGETANYNISDNYVSALQIIAEFCANGVGNNLSYEDSNDIGTLFECAPLLDNHDLYPGIEQVSLYYNTLVAQKMNEKNDSINFIR